MVIVGDVLVTKIIEKVIDVGFNYLADQYTRHAGGMKDELQRLKVALPRIQAVVAAADNAWTLEQQTANPGLHEWLQQFKDALYEADDALDELEYLRLQKQVEADDDRRDEDHNKDNKIMLKLIDALTTQGISAFHFDLSGNGHHRTISSYSDTSFIFKGK